MKLIIALLFSISSMATFAQGPQTWPDAFDQEAVDIIKEQLAAFIVEEEIDIEKVLEGTKFPFIAGSTSYTKEKFAASFSEIFSDELLDEVTNSDTFEAMSAKGDSYMCVCRNAPEGYSGAVVTFQLVGDVWMMSGLGLY